MAVRLSEILSNLFFPSIKKILVIPVPTRIQALIFRKIFKNYRTQALVFLSHQEWDLKYPVFIFIHYKKSFEIYTHSFRRPSLFSIAQPADKACTTELEWQLPQIGRYLCPANPIRVNAGMNTWTMFPVSSLAWISQKTTAGPKKLPFGKSVL